MAEENSSVNPSEDGAGPPRPEAEGSEEAPELDQLPPPVFPPGARRHQVRTALSEHAGEAAGDGDIPRDAFISPDDPIRPRPQGGVPDDAFISPDDPFVRASRDVQGVATHMSGEAGGPGEGPVYAQSSLVQAGPDVQRLAGLLETLARDLRDEGTRSLTVQPDTPRFEAMLRSMLAGYLAGKGEGGRKQF